MSLIAEMKKQLKGKSKPNQQVRYAADEAVRAFAKRIFAKYKATMRKLAE
jgi:hypothetical protein